jgi:hypothetical protein
MPIFCGAQSAFGGICGRKVSPAPVSGNRDSGELLHPFVVIEQHRRIAGERRLKAVQALGVALDSESEAVLSYYVGKRDAVARVLGGVVSESCVDEISSSGPPP